MPLKYKRIKASTLTVPKHKYADPFRIVILEFDFNGKVYHATAEEIITRDGKDMPWFVGVDHSYTDIPYWRFEERMAENKVSMDFEFKQDEEWTEW